MTTICFDGKELVADSRMCVADVDENKRILPIHSLEQVKVRNNDAVKIIEPKHFTLDGEPVLAVAVAGDGRLMASLTHIDEHDEINGKVVVREFYSDAFFGQYSDLSCESELIVVAKSKWAAIKMNPHPADSLVDYDYTINLFERDDALQWTMSGSGYAATMEAIKHPNFSTTGITAESLKRKNARKCVTLGIICDAFSGGPLRVWSEDSGVSVVEIDAGAQVLKEYMEANQYKEGTPPIDEVSALKRRDEILAERAARQAA